MREMLALQAAISTDQASRRQLGKFSAHKPKQEHD